MHKAWKSGQIPHFVWRILKIMALCPRGQNLNRLSNRGEDIIMHSEERQSCIDQIFALPTRVEAAIGEVTLAGLLKIYAWHGVHHLGQITELRESGCGEENGDLVI
ncbi:MAG TPA: hypothetical protein DIT99_32000 [Candidatus Latescibacteria bacterium]|nr:hypothetical protein [Candidatus Latescibacterota bacterium]